MDQDRDGVETTPRVMYILRDHNPDMSAAWETTFSPYSDLVKVVLFFCFDYIVTGYISLKYLFILIQISTGDIFNGGPAADAIVSPANSFGFMDGGIDMVRVI